MKLSAIVLTHNNQDTIKSCLESLSIADEIIVIDNYSTDNTIKIVKSFTKKIYTNSLDANWAKHRNFALKKATNNWVLFLDADEVVSSQLAKEIHSLPEDSDTNGYQISRLDHFLGSYIHFGEMGHTKLLRLANKNKGSWRRAVHEVWDITPPIGTLKAPIYHQRNISLTDFISRLNFYTDIDRGELKKEKKDFSYKELFKPPLKFIYNYIFLLGFLDGIPGLFSAYLMSFNSLIVRVKSWESH